MVCMGLILIIYCEMLTICVDTVKPIQLADVECWFHSLFLNLLFLTTVAALRVSHLNVLVVVVFSLHLWILCNFNSIFNGMVTHSNKMRKNTNHLNTPRTTATKRIQHLLWPHQSPFFVLTQIHSYYTVLPQSILGMCSIWGVLSHPYRNSKETICYEA